MPDAHRLPEERELYQKLHELLAADTILQLMAEAGGQSPAPTGGPQAARADLTPLNPAFGQLYPLIGEVTGGLQMGEAGVEFYLFEESRPLAQSCLEIGPGGSEQGGVVLSTGLLELLPADELKAVIAHELAHLRYGHHRLRLCADWLRLESKQEHLYALANLYGYWRGLAEISADLAGLAVVSEPRSVITALARQNLRTLVTGLDVESFLRQWGQSRDLRHGDGLLTPSGLSWEFRASVLLHCLECGLSPGEQPDVSGWTEKLKVSPDDDGRFLEFVFLLLAGNLLIRADGVVHAGELHRLRDILARLVHDPDPQLLELENTAAAVDSLRQIGGRLVADHPARVEKIYRLLCSLVLQDGLICLAEKQVLQEAAAALAIPEARSATILLDLVRRDFHPGITPRG